MRVIILGSAKPDCDWVDKGSKLGCREQSVFQMFVKGPDGEFESHKFHFCRSHASFAWTSMIIPLARNFAEGLPGTKAVVYDLDRLKEFEEMKAKKMAQVIQIK